MKSRILILIAAALTLPSCESYNQFTTAPSKSTTYDANGNVVTTTVNEERSSGLDQVKDISTVLRNGSRLAKDLGLLDD